MRKVMLCAGARAGWVLALGVALASGAAAFAAETPQRYAVIIGNNASLDQGVARLSYADQDAVKFYELFKAAGAHVRLLAALDPENQRRFTEAAQAMRPPSHQQLLATLAETFQQIRADREAGRETHFYFVYSGHGQVGRNHEGYVNLVDARFTRSQLYREVIGPSPAAFNHIILDACQAYFLVQRRGGPGDKEGDYRAVVQDFLASQELAGHPNTGVILAASSESETHEWGRWEAGIFSHELRSALLGAADVDGDGRVTYAEAAAFVDAANAAIDVPRARLRVFYRAPPSRPDLPLLDLAALADSPMLEVDPEHAEHIHVEDARGLRVADLHPSREQNARLALVGREPFFLRAGEREALVQGRLRVPMRELAFAARSEAAKGSVEESFRRDLFRRPFGLAFYRADVTARVSEELRMRPVVGGYGDAGEPRALRLWGWAGVGTGAALGAGAAVAYGFAASAYRDYQNAGSESQANALRATTEQRLLASRVLGGGAVGLAAAGVVMLVVDSRRDSRANVPISLGLAPVPGGGAVAAAGTW
jgi:hypothetical protein